ncbi:hypothetical protein [Aestuariivirga sp.]|uniref:hypothetical protein n=1 Tax=Aestuariivirga sp. TaxID=2650926 RepID=UPI0039E6BF7D
MVKIKNLSRDNPGISRAVADFYCEALCVCLDRHHTSPETIHIENLGQIKLASLKWPSSSTFKAAHANEIDATEAGAYAICIAAINKVRNLVAVARAETGTGADYYLAEPGTTAADLEDCIRLEVSGINRGNKAAVKGRLRVKVQQAVNGKSNLPAIASVVSFSALLVAIEDVP